MSVIVKNKKIIMAHEYHSKKKYFKKIIIIKACGLDVP